MNDIKTYYHGHRHRKKKTVVCSSTVLKTSLIVCGVTFILVASIITIAMIEMESTTEVINETQSSSTPPSHKTQSPIPKTTHLPPTISSPPSPVETHGNTTENDTVYKQETTSPKPNDNIHTCLHGVTNPIIIPRIVNRECGNGICPPGTYFSHIAFNSRDNSSSFTATCRQGNPTLCHVIGRDIEDESDSMCQDSHSYCIGKYCRTVKCPGHSKYNETSHMCSDVLTCDTPYVFQSNRPPNNPYVNNDNFSPFDYPPCECISTGKLTMLEHERHQPPACWEMVPRGHHQNVQDDDDDDDDDDDVLILRCVKCDAMTRSCQIKKPICNGYLRNMGIHCSNFVNGQCRR